MSKSKNVHEIEITIEGKKWEDFLDKAFKAKRKDIKLDGFRKGSVPKEVFLKKVGIESLYMDAIDMAASEAYKTALNDSKLIPVIQPSMDVTNVSKESVTFKFVITTKPDVKLGEYKNLGIKKDTVKVSKKEIDEEIKNLQTKYAEIVEKEEGVAKNGNTAIIDFEGFVEGKPLAGGNGENYPLELGSNTFIPGFEDAIIGMNINDEKSVDLKFPENYTEELKGKDVTFKITLKGLKEKVLPEINKEFFLDLGYEDVSSEEDLRKKVENDIKERKEKEAENKYIDECIEKSILNMNVSLNEEIIDDEVHNMIHQMEDNLRMQGLSLDQYMEFAHLTHEDLHKQMEEEATKRVKVRYLLEEVINAEKIEISDKEAEEEIKKIAKEYDISDQEVKKQFGGSDLIKYDLKMRKAIDVITGLSKN